MKARIPLVLALAVLCAPACHRNPRPAPPPAPVAPTPPPPAPEPTPEPVPPPDEAARLRAMDVEDINRLGLFADVRFDFDRSDISEAGYQSLRRSAETLGRFGFLQVDVEGHCDARGTADYNLALGERRAAAVRDVLTSLGVSAGRLRLVSYGKETPLCEEPSEACWARNRRSSIVVTAKRND